ncbi:hypothetical protein N7533_010998 [Penicillium manginii]|uniref:uncharacterized protein n=1 Tax=Penicillium manginii TaxID=203109 RepID=UPI0025494449|nr:uncharacterized protein N7533_010998 [Penicillium manginii]KAJ5741589.1 hypothetical protein N7533_010998 [Penicillium manginii]
MEPLVIYAILAGSLLLTFALIRILKSLVQWKDSARVFVFRHLIYPSVISRHSLAGPWSPAGILTHLTYATINIFLACYKSSSLEIIGRRAGDLSLINMAFPVVALHLSFAADLLGISLPFYRKLHRVSGWMTAALTVLHMSAHGFRLDTESAADESKERRLSTIVAAGCLAALLLISLPFVRKFSYEAFLRSHQGLTIASIYGIWRHIPKVELLPSLYLIVGVGMLAVTSLLYIAMLLYRNGIFSGNGYPRARFLSTTEYSEQEKTKVSHDINDVPLKISLFLPRPVKVRAGQYVNVWLPAVSFWSWTQTHPFTVISWSQRKQSVLELLVQPQKGLTGTIGRQLRNTGASGYSSLVLFSGPHGVSEPVDEYENVLLISSGSGLAAVLPYARKLIHGYNTCTSRVRRVHLLWQVDKRVEIAIAAQEQVNELLKEDLPDNGHVGYNVSMFKQKLTTS